MGSAYSSSPGDGVDLVPRSSSLFAHCSLLSIKAGSSSNSCPSCLPSLQPSKILLDHGVGALDGPAERIVQSAASQMVEDRPRCLDDAS
ncbi:hypothetical protein MLD38_005717 [Melastoma candidum]|uniref:Uncharacterized protein n=1 Tax=Melastoma candidum TaxID=119954 RepID=A0ACB9RL50_9MYRT|nr:hypothetical protein MLD38_005717 [Melastoma candidum]